MAEHDDDLVAQDAELDADAPSPVSPVSIEGKPI